MLTRSMLEKEKVGFTSSFLSPNPTRNKFEESVRLKFQIKIFLDKR